MFVSSVTYQQPVTWQPSKDGERLIGRIVLDKRMKDGTVPADTGALLGLKVMDVFMLFLFLHDVEHLAYEQCVPRLLGER